MTVINPNSISGITSITLPSGDGNVLTIHTNDGTERFRIDSSGNVKVGSACTISPDGDVFFTGVTTATTFTGAHSGSGANLTNLPAANITGTLPAISAANLTNVPAANITGTLPALNAASLTQIPAANIVGVCTSGFERTGGFGGGKIVQIVQAFKKDTQLLQSQSFVDLAGLNPSITPEKAGSKIIVHFVINYSGSGDNAFQLHRSIAGGSYAELTDYRGDADSDSTNATRCIFGSSGTGGYEIETASGYILDDPSYSVGQAIAYKFQFCSPYHSTYKVGINRGKDLHNSTYDKRTISYITLMEVES